MNKEKENNQKYSEDNRPIIFFNNNETLMKEKNENQSIKNLNNDLNNQNIIYYLATSIIALIIYSFCAWGTNIAFTEILDLELPLILLLTIVLSSCILQGYSKVSYLIYFIISCTLYFFSPSYTFFFVTALTSNIIVKYIVLICNNKYDYGNENSGNSKNIILKFMLRMKYYVILSLFIFIIFLIIGYFYA